MAVILSVEHLRKHFGPEPVLSDVTFQVRSGDKIGLVGPNGCGKTTLLNIIAGLEESERGRMEKSSDISIGYLHQRPEIAQGRTVLEEAHLALEKFVIMQKEAQEIAEKIGELTDPLEHDRLARRYDRIHEELMHHDAYNIDYRIEMILHGVGFNDDDFGKELQMLSGGEMNRLSLAKLLLAEPDIMLLDEPSNHLDLSATEWLEDFLVKTNAAVILVSHDRYFLDKVTNRTLELFMGSVDDYPGNFSKYTLLKEERLAVETRTYEKYVEEVEKAKDFIRRHHYGMKATQAEDRRKKLLRLEETPAELPRKITTPGMSFPNASRTGDIVFRLENLSKKYQVPLFKNLNLDIQRGERWAILGPNGCGKTTLLKCLLGDIEPDSGKVVKGEGVKVAYFDQQLYVLNNDELVVDAIRPPGIIFEELARRKLLGSFGLTGDQQLQTVGSLSGGQRCRAALAKMAAISPNIMILDEPTNHLDLWARAALERAISEFDGTVIFISHDRYFVDRVADHLLVIQPNARFRVIEGNYSTFRHLVAKKLIDDPFLAGVLQDNSATIATKKEENKAKTVTSSNKSASTKSAPTNKAISTSTTSVTGKSTNKGAKKEDWKKEYRQSDKKEPVVNLDEKNEKKKDAPTKTKRKFSFRKTHEIEEEVFIRETQIQSLQADMLRPEVIRNGERVKEIQKEIEAEQAALASLYEHWDEATQRNW